jgi:hypothetical protein
VGAAGAGVGVEMGVGAGVGVGVGVAGRTRGAESRHLHQPRGGSTEGSAGGVRTDGCDDPIFGDVAVGGGKQALGQTAGWADGGTHHVIASDQKIRGVLGDGRATAAGRAVAGRGRADVHRSKGVEAAIFEDSNIGKGGRGIEVDGDSVSASGNILGVKDGLGAGG